jgi:hypothetical protein
MQPSVSQVYELLKSRLRYNEGICGAQEEVLLYG